MRTYLVVIDDSAESRVALRFAARRAARTGSAVEILALIDPPEFVQWGGVQAAMEEEARLRAEAMVLEASGAILDEAGIQPSVITRQGDPVKVIGELLAEREVAALVLATSSNGGPGPLVAHFSNVAASLPCPLMIVPGGLSEEALDRIS
ncbi:universal stress protein [Allosphingosinicella flava]|uniref:Universal stress protein n=1 Tax=Allosphingosinicella flava TaxID=2771430 RepID=A0A7T2LL74_9SPHN|nr:universal stress protein [Sphingosinicella flava]QPQ54129.1 universal stress protein [Sphingosinicella flava]